ncbi:MAG: hypothetical protein JXR58_07325 [Bacteroidales bacterium]|nr:hypothetical protein [Bacteroidales bacterium]
MKNSFFKIRENIEDFVKKETKECEAFSFVISEIMPVEFTYKDFKTFHWLVKTKSKRALEEFIIELENKFSSAKGFAKSDSNLCETPEFVYLAVK